MSVPTDEQFYSSEDRTKPDIAFLKNHFYREGRLTEEQALFILTRFVIIDGDIGITIYVYFLRTSPRANRTHLIAV